MKTPLRYQITEFDCGPTSFLNALSFLYEREDIPAILVKQIFKYTLDRYDKFGVMGNGGTSEEAVDRFTKWIASHINSNEFGINCKIMKGTDISIGMIHSCLIDGGVVFAKCYQDTEHYVVITRIKNKKLYIFDSYYLEKGYYDHDRQVKIVVNKPFSYNRIVNSKRFFSDTKKDFSLGPVSQRECVLIYKNSDRK